MVKRAVWLWLTPESDGRAHRPEIAAARGRALAVLANHHNLLLALPGPGARLTAGDRTRLSALIRGAG